jgi:uridine monophosphate synthetase
MYNFELERMSAEITENEIKRLAAMLYEVGAVKFGAFRLKQHETNPDAPLSPIYLNLRILRSYPPVMAYTCALMDKICKPLEFELYADIPTAVTPLVSILSYLNNIPMISPRKDAKGYGLGVDIDGDFREGQRVLLVDDVVSLAYSKFEAIDKLERAGLVVQDLLMVIDRQQGGVQALIEKGYRVHLVATLSQLMAHYLESSAIDQARYDEVINYLGQN